MSEAQGPATTATRRPKDDDTLEQLLLSCDSITSKCLSYRPATQRRRPPPARERTTSSSTSDSIDLDGNIFQAHLELRARRMPRQNLLDDDNAVAKLQQDLTGRKLCLHVENLLLKRLTMSRAVGAEQDADQAALRREAARSRDREMTLAMQRQKELSKLLSSIRKLELCCHHQRQENRTIFERTLEQREHKLNQSDGDCFDSASTPTGDGSIYEMRMFARQNIILKSLLKDLVVGSGLDWSTDSRLRRIMYAPESVEGMP